MNITKSLTREERISFMLNLLPLISKVRVLTNEEIELIIATYNLPSILTATPFSSSSRRLLKEGLSISDQKLSKLIGQITQKGYLVEEHGEKIMREPIRKAIDFILSYEPRINITVRDREEKEQRKEPKESSYEDK